MISTSAYFTDRFASLKFTTPPQSFNLSNFITIYNIYSKQTHSNHYPKQYSDETKVPKHFFLPPLKRPETKFRKNKLAPSQYKLKKNKNVLYGRVPSRKSRRWKLWRLIYFIYISNVIMSFIVTLRPIRTRT